MLRVARPRGWYCRLSEGAVLTSIILVSGINKRVGASAIRARAQDRRTWGRIAVSFSFFRLRRLLSAAHWLPGLSPEQVPRAHTPRSARGRLDAALFTRPA